MLRYMYAGNYAVKGQNEDILAVILNLEKAKCQSRSNILIDMDSKLSDM